MLKLEDDIIVAKIHAYGDVAMDVVSDDVHDGWLGNHRNSNRRVGVPRCRGQRRGWSHMAPHCALYEYHRLNHLANCTTKGKGSRKKVGEAS